MEKNFGTESAVGLELYEAIVAQETLDRVGNCQNGKGVAHEIMYRDKCNIDPANILAGKRTELTRSTTAIRDDLIVKQDNHVVGRMQLKDTPASVQKTLQQASSHKYAGTNLMGTKETTALYNEKAAARVARGGAEPQKMTSTGISSRDTERVANKALGQPTSFEGILSGAATAAKTAAVLSAAVTAVGLLGDEENHSFEEVVQETAKSAAVGTASGAAGVVGGEAVANLVGKIAAPVFPTAAIIGGTIAAAEVAATVAKPTVEGIVDAISCKMPELALYGLQEGVEDLVEKGQESLEWISDTICDVVESVVDFVDGLFWWC